MLEKKTLIVGIQLALGVGLIAPVHAAQNVDNTNLSGGGFTFGGGLNLTNSQLKFNLRTDGTYGAMNVSGGDYSGSGSTITMNSFFDAGGSTLADQGSNRILINGNASGQTTLVVNNNGGPGASTDLNGNTFNDAGEGISLAQVSGSSAANVFSLQGDYVAVGAYQYRLYAYAPGQSDAGQRLVSADADGHWDYRLQNAKVATGIVPVAPVNPGGTTPSAPATPAYRPGLVPQAPSYLVQQNALFAYGQQTINALHQRLGETGGAHTPDEGNGELYVRAFGGDHRYASNLTVGEYGYDYDQDIQGLQIGGNWLKLDGDAGSLRLGLALSSGKSHVEPASVTGVEPTVFWKGQYVPVEVSRSKTRADSLAATVTWQHAGGFYVDGVIGASEYRSEVFTPYRDGRVARLESNDVFASVEAGYGWAASDFVTIEPQAQVSWQKLDTDRVTDVDGVVVDLGTPEQFVWRVGARALFTPAVGADGSVLTQYIKLNYYGSEG
ncbi:MAG TPA: autotransporter outer membrane beta-barrel domain-containing protein, partial [Povalibacter sp.]